MVSTFTQATLVIAGLAIVAGFLSGYGLKSGIVAVAACIAAACILHFAAP